MQASQPIGIFDSGVGGLTVANAIRQILPDEQMIYFGDTFHLPYGDKSAESVKFYATRISEYLLSLNCKLILIACNTASALAWEAVSDTVRGKALAMNVIDPVIDEVAGSPKIQRIGVIGTKGTINSGTYKVKLIQKNNNLDIRSLATPLFVPMIEEGFIFDDISNAIIRNYLSREELQGIDTLILGCTHYPIIKQQIARFFDFKVQIVDSAAIVAKRLRKLLRENNLLNRDTESPAHQFLVSDYTEYFEIIARMFFEGEIKLQKIDLWRHT